MLRRSQRRWMCVGRGAARLWRHRRRCRCCCRCRRQWRSCRGRHALDINNAECFPKKQAKSCALPVPQAPHRRAQLGGVKVEGLGQPLLQPAAKQCNCSRSRPLGLLPLPPLHVSPLRRPLFSPPLLAQDALAVGALRPGLAGPLPAQRGCGWWSACRLTRNGMHWT